MPSGSAPSCACAFSRRSFLSVGTCTMTALLAGFGGSGGVAIASMVRDQERTYPVPAADGVTIDRDAQVILVRQAQNVYAFNLSCPHQNAAVKWNTRGRQFQCSRHDSRYFARRHAHGRPRHSQHGSLSHSQVRHQRRGRRQSHHQIRPGPRRLDRCLRSPRMTFTSVGRRHLPLLLCLVFAWQAETPLQAQAVSPAQGRPPALPADAPARTSTAPPA